MKLRPVIALLICLLAGCATPSATQPAAPAASAAGSGFGYGTRAAGDGRDVLVRQLTNVDASAAAALLQQLLGVPARGVSATNCVVAVGTAQQLKLAGGILDTIDKANDDGEPITFLYPLKHAQAAQVAATLEQLSARGMFYPAAQQSTLGNGNWEWLNSQPKLSPAQRAAALTCATADLRTNTVIVGTPRSNVNGLVKIIDELDKPFPAPPASAPSIIPAGQ